VRARPIGYGDLLELHASLRDIKPVVWRRVRVPADLVLGELHEVLQIAFGWDDSHLHDFEVGGLRFAPLDVEDELLAIDEDGSPIGAVVRVGAVFTYRYDFGDDWEHQIKVERIVDRADDTAIACVGGERACPPEDVGGAQGYANMLAALASPDHPEHLEMRAWVGRRFDPARFDLGAVNKKLKTLARQLGRLPRPRATRLA
jgi:hypothetical protein